MKISAFALKSLIRKTLLESLLTEADEDNNENDLEDKKRKHNKSRSSQKETDNIEKFLKFVEERSTQNKKIKDYEELKKQSGGKNPRQGGKFIKKPEPIDDINVTGLSFNEKDLTDYDFSGLDLSGCSFNNCLLYRTNFSDCDLEGANFYACNSSGGHSGAVNFTNANLQSAEFVGKASGGGSPTSRFLASDFTGANLQNSYFAFVTLKDSVLNGANLIGADMGDSSTKTGKPKTVNLDRVEINDETKWDNTTKLDATTRRMWGEKSLKKGYAATQGVTARELATDKSVDKESIPSGLEGQTLTQRKYGTAYGKETNLDDIDKKKSSISDDEAVTALALVAGNKLKNDKHFREEMYTGIRDYPKFKEEIMKMADINQKNPSRSSPLRKGPTDLINALTKLRKEIPIDVNVDTHGDYKHKKV